MAFYHCGESILVLVFWGEWNYYFSWNVSNLPEGNCHYQTLRKSNETKSYNNKVNPKTRIRFNKVRPFSLFPKQCYLMFTVRKTSPPSLPCSLPSLSSPCRRPPTTRPTLHNSNFSSPFSPSPLDQATTLFTNHISHEKHIMTLTIVLRALFILQEAKTQHLSFFF